MEPGCTRYSVRAGSKSVTWEWWTHHRIRELKSQCCGHKILRLCFHWFWWDSHLKVQIGMIFEQLIWKILRWCQLKISFSKHTIKCHKDYHPVIMHYPHPWLQIRVRVSDGGTPPRTDITVVSVKVNRNLEKPVFDPVSYSLRTQETLPLGSVVATVSAKDADRRVNKSEEPLKLNVLCHSCTSTFYVGLIFVL